MRSMCMGTCQSGLLDGKPKAPALLRLQRKLAGTPRRSWWLAGLACLVVTLTLSMTSGVLAQTTPAGTFDSRILLGPDGENLLFANQDELSRFLASAEETSAKLLSRGITGAKRLTLEQGGVEARVIFHDVDQMEQRPKRLLNGRTVMYLRDSYKSQIAAYRLGRLLGMQNVPPTVGRVSEAASGSAQLWIEEAVTEDIRR